MAALKRRQAEEVEPRLARIPGPLPTAHRATLARLHAKLEALETGISVLEVESLEREQVWLHFKAELATLERINGKNAFSLLLNRARGHIDLDRLRASTSNIKVRPFFMNIKYVQSRLYFSHGFKENYLI